MELERLIESEQRNDEVMRRAVADAASIVATARGAVQQRETAFAVELQRVIATSAAGLAAERERRQAAIVASANAAVARYAAVTDAEIAAVAQVLIADLVADQGNV